MTIDPLAAAKAEMRESAKSRRTAASEATPGAARIAASHAFREIVRQPHIRSVAGYLPVRGEIDPLPLMHLLHGHEITLCLPVVTGPGQPLAFRPWRPGARLVRGAYGIMIPEEAEEVTPQALVTPLLAYDARGYRLGYGGGYYDRTIAELGARGPLRTIGLAFAGQQVPEVPAGAHDMPLDAIATENGITGFDRSGAP